MSDQHRSDTERDGDLFGLFAPLRTSAEAPEDAVRRVRAAAGVPGRGRRPLIAGTGVAAALAATALVVVVIDSSQPGTFVGVASARDVLQAAADATRDDPAPVGWSWTTDVRVERQALEGRPCGGCAVERAVLQTTRVEEFWSGPRGETYTGPGTTATAAIENEPVLRRAGALDPPAGPKDGEPQGFHRLPAPAGVDDEDEPQDFGLRGGLINPEKVPDRPHALVRWLSDHIAAASEAQQRLVRRQGSRIVSAISRSTRVNYGLIDLSVSPQLSGPQRAAAFEALSTRRGVTLTKVPAFTAAPDRVAVRVTAEPGDDAEFHALPIAGRIIVFDRSTHRVVAEARKPSSKNPNARLSFGSGATRRSLRMVAGGGGETRYGTPVSVGAPGFDDEGRQRLKLDRLLEMQRDGRAVTP
jgi:hypothetical protein